MSRRTKLRDTSLFPNSRRINSNDIAALPKIRDLDSCNGHNRHIKTVLSLLNLFRFKTKAE